MMMADSAFQNTDSWCLLRDPYFFEIIFRQGEKYPQVNVLLLK